MSKGSAFSASIPPAVHEQLPKRWVQTNFYGWPGFPLPGNTIFSRPNGIVLQKLIKVWWRAFGPFQLGTEEDVEAPGFSDGTWPSGPLALFFSSLPLPQSAGFCAWKVRHKGLSSGNAVLKRPWVKIPDTSSTHRPAGPGPRCFHAARLPDPAATGHEIHQTLTMVCMVVQP